MSDLIDRQAAIDAIPETHISMFENCRECELLTRDQVIDIISELPPIYPEPTAADIVRQINEELSKPTKACGLLMKKKMEDVDDGK